MTEIKKGQVREAAQSEEARAAGVAPDTITIISAFEGSRWVLAKRGNGQKRNWTRESILKWFPVVRGEP